MGELAQYCVLLSQCHPLHVQIQTFSRHEPRETSVIRHEPRSSVSC